MRSGHEKWFNAVPDKIGLELEISPTLSVVFKSKSKSKSANL